MHTARLCHWLWWLEDYSTLNSVLPTSKLSLQFHRDKFCIPWKWITAFKDKMLLVEYPKINLLTAWKKLHGYWWQKIKPYLFTQPRSIPSSIPSCVNVGALVTIAPKLQSYTLLSTFTVEPLQFVCVQDFNPLSLPEVWLMDCTWPHFPSSLFFFLRSLDPGLEDVTNL